MHLFYLPEFICQLLNIVTEIRMIFHQMQIASQPDTFCRLSYQRPAYADPVLFGIQCGIPALRECRGSSQAHRKQIRVEPQLMDRDISSCAEPCLITGEYTFYKAVKPELGKQAAVRFNTNPAVIIEHISLLAIAVHQVNQFFSKRPTAVNNVFNVIVDTSFISSLRFKHRIFNRLPDAVQEYPVLSQLFGGPGNPGAHIKGRHVIHLCTPLDAATFDL